MTRSELSWESSRFRGAGHLQQRGPEALKAQFVPLDQALWRVDRFREFAEARRKLLVEAINEFFQ